MTHCYMTFKNVKIWNTLPPAVTTCPSLRTFLAGTRTILLSNQRCEHWLFHIAPRERRITYDWSFYLLPSPRHSYKHPLQPDSDDSIESLWVPTVNTVWLPPTPAFISLLLSFYAFSFNQSTAGWNLAIMLILFVHPSLRVMSCCID